MKQNIKRSLLVAGSIAVLGLGALGVSGIASAQTDSSSSLIDKLVSTFHLNKADVQKVFDQQRTEDQTARQAEEKTRLDQAVKYGKITQDQENKIIAKRAEIEKNREANRTTMESKTKAERKAVMDAERTTLQQWAKDNNIPEQYILGMGGHGHGGPGFGRPQDGSAPTTSPAPSPSS